MWRLVVGGGEAQHMGILLPSHRHVKMVILQGLCASPAVVNSNSVVTHNCNDLGVMTVTRHNNKADILGCDNSAGPFLKVEVPSRVRYLFVVSIIETTSTGGEMSGCL